MSAANPQPLLGLPSRRANAFRAIETILREDPVLAEKVATWRSREGVDTDMQDVGVGEMPLIALSPFPVPNQIRDESTSKITLEISVELFVQGTCVEDILGLWEAVEDAVVGSKPYRGTTVRAFLCNLTGQPIDSPLGVMKLWPTIPSFFGVDVTKGQNSSEYQAGAGKLTCFLSRPA